MNHLRIWYNPSVKESILQFSGEHALVEHTRQLLLCEVLQLLVDQVLDQVVRVLQDACHDLVVEFWLREIGRLLSVECLLIVGIRQRVEIALITLSGMVVPALHPLGALAFLALVYLVVQGMVHLLFPAVASCTVCL